MTQIENSQSSAETVESYLASLPEPAPEPLLFIVLFGERPLQVIPPDGQGPHLVVFDSKGQANRFLEKRRQYYPDEPLSLLAIDPIDQLDPILTLPSVDHEYAGPPVGLVFNFDYQEVEAELVFAPDQVEIKSLREHLRVGTEEAQAVEQPASPPSPTPDRVPKEIEQATSAPAESDAPDEPEAQPPLLNAQEEKSPPPSTSEDDNTGSFRLIAGGLVGCLILLLVLTAALLVAGISLGRLTFP